MSQREMVIAHLEAGYSISNLEALEEYGIGRLSDIILKLRREGYPIKTVMIRTKNRYGKEIIYGRYELEKVQEQED